MSAPKQYDLTSRIIHWTTAAVVIAMFGVGLWMVDLDYYSSWYQTAPHWHKSVGVLIALLTVFRLIWRLSHAAPTIEGTPIERKAAKAAHHFMYCLLFVIFISGYLISTPDGRPVDVFGWFSVPSAGELFENQSDIAGAVHYYTAFALIALAVLHAMAALKHHFINKDNTLRKMMGDKT